MAKAVLLGEKCVDTLSTVYAAFVENKVAVTSDFFRVKDIAFHPIISGFKESLERINHRELVNYFQSNYRNVRPEIYIKNAHELYNNYGIKDTFEFLSSDFEIISLDFFLENRGEFVRAIEILKEASPWMGQLLDLVISDIWFLARNGENRFLGGGASVYEHIGLILMSFRPHSSVKEIELSIAIAHELGHNCFFLLQAGQNPIQLKSWDKEVYSGLRQVKRPSFASLHAAVALGYMLSFCLQAEQNKILCQDLDCGEFLNKRILEYHQSLSAGLEALNEIELNELGSVVVFELMQVRDSVACT